MKSNKIMKGLAAATAMALALVMVPSSVAKADGTYTVEKDDCLTKISKKLTGTEKFWQDIYNANSGVVKGDYIIYTGQQLIIPDSVIVAAPVVPEVPTVAVVPEVPAVPVLEEETANPTDSVDMTDYVPAETTEVPADEPTEGAPLDKSYDYDTIVSWASVGCIREDELTLELIAFNDNLDYALIIWANKSDMTAASFMGPIVDNDGQRAIVDVVTGLPQAISTCLISDDGKNAILLELEGLGASTLYEKSLPEVLETIKGVMDNYILL